MRGDCMARLVTDARGENSTARCRGNAQEDYTAFARALPCILHETQRKRSVFNGTLYWAVQTFLERGLRAKLLVS